MEKSNAYIGHILAFTAILIFSFNTNFMKSLMPTYISGYALVLARCILSTIFFWIIGLFDREPKEHQPTSHDLLIIMFGGVLAISCNLLLYIKGLELTGPIDAMVIRTLQPIIVIGIVAFRFHKSISSYKIIGIILGIAGTIFIAATPHISGVNDSLLGGVLIFLSTIATAVYLVIIQPYTIKYKTSTIMKWMSLSAVVVCFPFGYRPILEAKLFSGEVIPWAVWGQFAFTVFFASIVAAFVSVASLRYISAFVKSTYIYLLPITGTVVTLLLKIQVPIWQDFVAFVLIIIGFILVNITKRST